MNKRKAVLAILASLPVMLARKSVAAQIEGLPVIAPSKPADTSQRMVLAFDLKSFEKFEFFFGKEKVTLSPAEIFAALKES